MFSKMKNWGDSIYKVGIIGAGKVGTTLGLYLFNTFEYCISGYYSRNYDSAKYSADLTQSKAYSSLKDLVTECDILCITTNDDQIVQVWQNIKKYPLSGKIICHCSGSLSSEIFKDDLISDAYYCSLHPLMAIKNKETAFKDMGQAYFTLEGDFKAISVIEQCLKQKNNPYKIIPTKDKTNYHVAAVLLSNLTLALGNMSLRLLKEYDFNEEEALEALSSLASTNIQNFISTGPTESLTGPIERNDLGTVNKHIGMLSTNNQDIKSVYLLLSEELLNLAKEKNSNKNYSELIELVRKERQKLSCDKKWKIQY